MHWIVEILKTNDYTLKPFLGGVQNFNFRVGNLVCQFDDGVFQLLDLIITELKSHMTC